jgi:hypothetical protein
VTDELNPATPTQDTGLPDAVERDGLALNSAEDLDEDRMRVDPLEAGMDPPEQWMGVNKYGVTPYEQTHPRPLSQRLTEEEPDTQPDLGEQATMDIDEPGDADEPDERYGDQDVSTDPRDDTDEEVLSEARYRGQLADEAGGSVASAIRTPPPPE